MISRMISALIGLLLSIFILSPRPAAAVQTVSGNDPAPVRLSNRDLNRIVAPAKIIKIFTSKLTDAKDFNFLGSEAFVRIPPNISGPIELFVATEAGTFALIGIPSAIPSETIEIRGTEQSRAVEQAHPYVRQIKSLIRSVAQSVTPDGYDLITAPDRSDECPFMECELIPVRRYLGRQLTITEYRLSNPTMQTQTYSEELFLSPRVRAVSLDIHELPPGAMAKLIIIEDAQPSREKAP